MNSKINLTSLVLALALALLAGCQTQEGTVPATETDAPLAEMTQPEQETQPGMANPASENCIDLNGTVSIEQRPDGGQFGICYFEDNRQCEEWALLRGDCPVDGVKVTGYITPAARYCAITGGTYAITGNNGADDEQGTCTFSDGSLCDAGDYYNGQCAPGTEPIARPEPAAEADLAIQPLPVEVCNGQAQAMAHFLDVLEVTQADSPLSDFVTGATGTGCQATVTGTGADFDSPDAAVSALADMLEGQGWTEDPMLASGGPMGMGVGYRKGEQICLAAAMWLPDESANCPDDQPISACEVAPEQQNYNVTLNCGLTAAEVSIPAEIPLKDALANLEPQDVFQNFYNITQVPRPSGHLEQIREFLVNFGQELGLETVVDEAGNVIIRKPATAGLENRQGVVLQAHMDMVPGKDDDLDFDFATDPIQAVVSGDYLTAKGTTLGADDGIGMAMIMAVLQSQTLQTGPLEGLFTVDEETDMSGANGLQEDALQGSILINLDSEWDGVFLIGAAGGGHVEVTSSYAQVPAPADAVSYQVKVQGLKGGHSGVDINLGRGHAIKLLVRLLKGGEPYALRLVSIIGGSAGNAIPREAAAVVVLPENQEETFAEYVRVFETTIKFELSAIEPDLSVELVAVQTPVQMMDETIQAKLIDALYATPQGVMRMSDALPGVVETSTNLGVVNVQDGQIEVICVPRSSVDSALDDVSQMIASVWELAGAEVAFTDYYQGWNPDPESPILSLMESTYRDLYGQEPEVMAVHAGLECGVIGAKYPHMDMISIGPTLNDVHSPAEKLLIPAVDNVMNLLLEVLQNIPEG